MRCAPTSKRSRSGSRSVSSAPESAEAVADAEPTPQTYRTNEQMMQAMKGATMALGSMNKTMNLPSLQRIAMEFERENDIMEQRQEMMDDAIDDAMDVGLEEEGDEVVERVLEEIGVDLSQAVRPPNFVPLSEFILLTVYADGRNTNRSPNQCCPRKQNRPSCWWWWWWRRCP